VNGNEYAQKLVAYNQEIMESIGLEKDRLQIIFVSAAEGERFKNLCTDLDRKIRSLGPNPIKPIRKSILEAEAKKAAAKKAKEQAK
jgi:coenzyme F420-reducing hydrogenase delta subunit